MGFRSWLRSLVYVRDPIVDYWTKHNVTLHRKYHSSEQSIADFHWRNAQYFNYIDLMPVSGADDLTVLDFGCGPGFDLVGFATESRPKRLIGIDISSASLAEAKDRLALHAAASELYHHEILKNPLRSRMRRSIWFTAPTFSITWLQSSRP